MDQIYPPALMRCESVKTNLHTSSWCPENRAKRLCWNLPLPLSGVRWYAPMSAAWERYSTSRSNCSHGNKLYGNTIKKVEIITPSHISHFTTSQFGFYGIKVTRRLNKTVMYYSVYDTPRWKTCKISWGVLNCHRDPFMLNTNMNIPHLSCALILLVSTLQK